MSAAKNMTAMLDAPPIGHSGEMIAANHDRAATVPAMAAARARRTAVPA